MKLLSYVEQLKDLVCYDADREFYAKVFPGSIAKQDLWRLRRMRTADLPDVLNIERQVYNYPWSEDIFKDCFRIRYSCWVCEEIDDVLGYCIVSIAAGEAHIMNICVDPALQKQGVGRKMVVHMIDVAENEKASRIFLEVRPSNKNAISLYESLGFNEIGIRKAYYPGENGREDALMLAKDLPDSE